MLSSSYPLKCVSKITDVCLWKFTPGNSLPGPIERNRLKKVVMPMYLQGSWKSCRITVGSLACRASRIGFGSRGPAHGFFLHRLCACRFCLFFSCTHRFRCFEPKYRLDRWRSLFGFDRSKRHANSELYGCWAQRSLSIYPVCQKKKKIKSRRIASCGVVWLQHKLFSLSTSNVCYCGPRPVWR